MKRKISKDPPNGFIPLLDVILLLHLFTTAYLYAQTPIFQWASGAGGHSLDVGVAIAADNLGNSFVTGWFRDSAQFGTALLTSAGDDDIFIVKYSSTGNVVWANRAGGAAWDRANSIASDGAGNCVTVGHFQGTATFGSINLTALGGDDIFIAKYNASGNVVWAKQAGGILADAAIDVAIDESGNILVTGYFADTAFFDSVLLTNVGFADVFVAKYNAAGEVVWAKQAGGTLQEFARGIAADGLGNIVITGTFEGSITFGTTILTSAGGNDIFIAKYDASGNVVWAKQAGGINGFELSESGYDVSMDNSGNCYIIGNFEGEAIFETITLTSFGTEGHEDVFISKYNPNGDLLWVKQAGGTLGDNGYGIAQDEENNTYITGRFRFSAKFEDIEIFSNGLHTFIAKYDAAGNAIWAKKSDAQDLNAGHSSGQGIANDAAGDIVVTGSFGKTVFFDSNIITSNADESFLHDVFVTKLSEDGNEYATDFTFLRDNYSFTNDSTTRDVALKHAYNEKIGSVLEGTNFYNFAIISAAGSYLWSERMGEGGYCWGMIETAAIYHKFPELKPIAKDTYQYTRVEAIDGIQNYHEGQFFASFFSSWKISWEKIIRGDLGGVNEKSDYDDMLTYIQDGFPVVVGLASSSRRGGHAVLAYKIIKSGDMIDILVYDPNFLNSTRKISMFQIDESTIIAAPYFVNDDPNLSMDLFITYAPWLSGLGDLSALREMLLDLVDNFFRDLLDRAKGWLALSSPANAVLIDEQGRRLGSLGDSLVNEIPGATILDGSEVEIYEFPLEFNYTVEISGTGDGTGLIDIVLPEVNTEIIHGVGFEIALTGLSFASLTMHDGVVDSVDNDLDGDGIVDQIVPPLYHEVTPLPSEIPRCVTYDFNVEGGAWYLISLPIIPDNSSVDVLFPSAISAFGWDYAAQNYVPVTELEPGKAYWLLLLQPTTVGICGLAFNHYTRDYSEQGWDLTGSVFDTRPVIDNPDGAVQAMFGWNATAQNYALIDPMMVESQRGYWILVVNVPATVSVGEGGVSVQATKLGENVSIKDVYKKSGAFPPPPPFQSEEKKMERLPQKYELSQNYPNPFNALTVIEYQIPEAGWVDLKVYNLLGHEVHTLVRGEKSAGVYRVKWDAKNDKEKQVGSGIYFVRIQVGDFVKTQEVILLR